MILTDEEFRAKLEKHFSLYRINLRSPLASQVIPNHWYRVDILLVNELGLFRRADIEPNGQVVVNCDLYKSNNEKSMTPLLDDEEDWEIEIKAAPAFTQGKLEDTVKAVPGFCASGKGAFLYRVKSRKGEDSVKGGKRYLHIKPTQLINFPKNQQQGTTDIILPLVIGPIEIIPEGKPQVQDTSLPLELWQQEQEIEMVYEGYRVFNSSPTTNIAVHEMWDSGIPGKIWDSALVMLDVIKNMIQYHPEYIHEKHVLDLSAGTGLLGLYIASIMIESPTKQGNQSKITITELDEAVDLIDKNIAINHYLVSSSFSSAAKPNNLISTNNLLWGNTEQAKTCGKADLIIASDVLYEAQFFEDLVKCFVDLSKPTTRIYIGYKRRGFDEAEEKRFWTLCQQHFQVTLLKWDGKEDIDDVLMPRMTLETGVQLYRLVSL